MEQLTPGKGFGNTMVLSKGGYKRASNVYRQTPNSIKNEQLTVMPKDNHLTNLA